MIDLHPNDEPNLHLQKALDEWQKVFDDDKNECEERRERANRRLRGHTTNSSAYSSLSYRRKAQEDTTKGREKKVWNPYHSACCLVFISMATVEA